MECGRMKDVKNTTMEYNPWIRMGSLWYQGQYAQVGRPENECEDEMIAFFSVNIVIIKVVLWLTGMFWLVQNTKIIWVVTSLSSLLTNG
jgi:uncharacterized Zn finger protein